MWTILTIMFAENVEVIKESSNNDFWNLFLTVLSGVLVFILCQLFIELVLNQIKRYKEIKAKISYALVYYADLYFNPITIQTYNLSETQKKDTINAQKELRGLAAELRAFAEEKWIVNYPNYDKIDSASAALIGLSNSLVSNNTSEVCEQNNKRVNEIKQQLKLKIKN